MSKDLFLALEIEIDCAFADFSPGGYVVYCGAMEPSVKELLPRGVKDLTAPPCLFSRTSIGSTHISSPLESDSESVTDRWSLYTI
jgi:hypothetical protein